MKVINWETGNFIQAMTALANGNKIRFKGLPKNQHFAIYDNSPFLYEWRPEHESYIAIRKGLAIMKMDETWEIEA